MKKNKYLLLLSLFLFICSFSACNNKSQTVFLSESQSDIDKENLKDGDLSYEEISMTQSKKNSSSQINESNQNSVENKDMKSDIFIHICGEVKNSGVYKLKEDMRVIDAVEAAGGFSKKADRNSINLAGFITDGQRIYIPNKSEVSENKLQNEISLNEINGDKSNAININTASKENLMTLKGIGASRADDIIDYRQKNGNFKKIDDIMKIKGIKQAMFDKIKDNITVN